MTQITIPRPMPARDLLTREEAADRARRVRDLAYEIDVDLVRDSEDYRGTCTLAFGLASLDSPLFIDFKGGDVTSMTVDGRAITPEVRDHRLWLSPDILSPRMRVTVSYRNRCDDTGDGFHRFTDPEDGEVYVYSNFQPFAAHRLFPCFDQPDLKAVFRLTVTAPGDWEVISGARRASVERMGDGQRLHRFELTKRFSPYLLSLVAGPYHAVIEEHRGLPLGLYGRRSLARQLEHDADELFTITRQGLDYYAELFDQPYPFTKFDQLFMPEFNIGAMENVGAVTIHDGYLYRDPPTETQRLERAEVVLHELAHMWFGNLVTMRWWDDLWLNESFATYISFLCLTEATRFTGAWKVFNSTIKRLAYRQDQLVTTHPISADAGDTQQALLNFDDITYGKGASVLKQLVATIGRDGFREGMRAYFRRHAWGNASLAEFLEALEEGSGVHLRAWARPWLETASLNTIAAECRMDGGQIASLTLRQTAPEAFPTLRPHAMEVALLSEGPDGLVVEALPARIDGPGATVAAAAGRPAPLLIFPNHEDHDYARVWLDERSLAFARERLSEVGDPLLRQLLWAALWDLVRDARLRSTEFLAICRDSLRREPDLELLDGVLGRVGTCLAMYIPDRDRAAECSATVSTALAAVRAAESRDARVVWARAAIGAASSPGDLEPLLDLADGHQAIEDFAMDQEMRWSLAVKAIAHGLPDADDRLAAERGRDRSDRGDRTMIRAAAARPAAEAKAAAWERIHGDGYGSLHLTRAAMQGFLWHSQRALLAGYRESFFERVRGIFATRDHPFAGAYMANLFPDRWAEPEVLERAQELLSALDRDETMLERQLREKIDELARAIRIREFAERGVGSAPSVGRPG